MNTNHGLPTQTVGLITAVFAQYAPVEQVILYGSRARDTFKNGSDIDLCMVGEGIDDDVILKIASDLEDLPIPYTVDLSAFHLLDHAKLREHIERVGVTLYERESAGLPAGWEVKTLGEVCDLQNGYAFQSKEYSESGYFVIRIGNVQNGFIELSNPKFVQLNKIKLEKFILNVGDVLISLTGNVGRVGVILKEHLPAVLNQRVARMILDENAGIEKKYLLYFLFSERFLIDLTKLGRGAAQQNVSTSDISAMTLPVPTIAEQQHIVAVLDEAFAAIDTARACAESNLKNAKALFESALQGVFEGKGDGWEATTIGQEIELITGFAFKSKNYSEDVADTLLLRGDNIMQGSLRLDDARRWNRFEYDDFKNYQLKNNDILLAMDRPWVKAGLKCVKLTEADLPALLVQRTSCLRSKASIDSSFLYLLVQSDAFMKYLLDVQTGSGVPHISGRQIQNFEFNKPTLKTQQTIVQKLDALSAQTQQLEAVYLSKIKALDELKKSILQKAFAGALSISKGANDEPY